MGFRVPSPDGKRSPDGRLFLVLPDGTILKDYYTVKYLTVGGMSIAYEGFKDGKKFFIKEVNGCDAQNVISLTQEKAILERLDHPGIVKVYDFFEFDGFCYLVMDFIEGNSLDKLISPFDNVFLQEKIVLDWAFQLYEIFEYLHGQNPPIIYRDLKPSNVIKDERGRIHLVDFGIARVYKEDRTSDTHPMGSTLTASPEHYGGRQTDERSDVFTLGATLNYLLTNGKGRKQEYFEFFRVRDINPKVSENTDQIIIKALKINPDDRFSSVSEMRRAHFAQRLVSPLLIVPSGTGSVSGNAPSTKYPTTFTEKEDFLKKTKIAGISSFFAIFVIFLIVVISGTLIGNYIMSGKASGLSYAYPLQNDIRAGDDVSIGLQEGSSEIVPSCRYETRRCIDMRISEVAKAGGGGEVFLDRCRFKICIPRGYNISEDLIDGISEVNEKLVFVKRDNNGDLIILRICVTNMLPFKVSLIDAVGFHIKHKLTSLNNFKMESLGYKMFRNKDLCELKFTTDEYKPIRNWQILFWGEDQNRLCVVTASAPLEIYRNYEKEFSTCFSSLDISQQ